MNGSGCSAVVVARVLLAWGALLSIAGLAGCGRKSSAGAGDAAVGGHDAGLDRLGAGGLSGVSGTGGGGGVVAEGGTGVTAGAGGGAAASAGAAGRGGGGAGGAAGALCGNRVVDPGEGCDDGNAQTGDGCSPSCRRIAGLSVGWGRIAVLLDDGSIKCWGDNSSGALGLGDTRARGDEPNEMGTYLPAVDLGAGRVAYSIASGIGATCATLGSQVKCWGANTLGVLGLGDENPRGDGPGEMGDNLLAIDLGMSQYPTSGIAAGGEQVCAVLVNRGLKCWGSGRYGALGLGNTAPHGVAPGQMGDNLPLVALGTNQSARDVVAGSGHTCAVLGSNGLKCWGLNASGQLGLGDKNDRGDGPGEMGDNLPMIDLGLGRAVRTASAGQGHTCAVVDGGNLKCWGANGQGQLGVGDTNDRGDEPGEMGESLPYVSLGTGRTAKQIVTGRAHTCVLIDNNSVKCWGDNAAGQLGLGDTAPRGGSSSTTPVNLPAVSLGAGRTARVLAPTQNGTCALLDNDTLKCWGENVAGQLGLEDVSARGDGPGEMGDALPAVILP